MAVIERHGNDVHPFGDGPRGADSWSRVVVTGEPQGYVVGFGVIRLMNPGGKRHVTG